MLRFSPLCFFKKAWQEAISLMYAEELFFPDI